MSKAILVIRKKIVCFKEGKQLFGDNGLLGLKDERGDSDREQFEGSDLFPFGDRENVSKFPRRREFTKIVGKLKKLSYNLDKF